VKTGVQVLPGLDEPARQHLSQRLSVTATRRFLLGAFAARAYLAFALCVLVLTAAICLIAIPGGLTAQAGSIRACVALIGFFLVTSTLSVVLYRPIIRTTLITWTRRQATYRGLALGLAAVSAYLEAGVLTEIIDEAHRPGMFEVYRTLGLAFGVVLVCGLMAGAAAGDERYDGVMEPLDLVFLQIFKIAIDLEKARDRRVWALPTSLSEINSDLERAARTAERTLRGRAAMTDLAARREASLLGAQLATVIRAHKPALAKAVGPRQIADVQRSLAAGLVAWSERDLDALIANAPPIALASRVRSAVRRVYPALVLSAAAIALPMIPALASRAGQIHTTLGVLAVLSLISEGVSPTASITDILARISR
jgi:hypothetical protein